MQGIHKSFSQELFDTHDRIAREVVKEYFQQHNITLTDNPDKYGPDLVSVSGSFVEVEHSQIWNDVPPFNEFHILGRKEECLKQSVAYCIVNKPLTKIAICMKPTLEKYMTPEHLKEFKNSMVSSGEMMWMVPHSEIRYVDAPPHFGIEKKARQDAAVRAAWRKVKINHRLSQLTNI